MVKAKRPILLIGGLPGNSAEEAMRACAAEVGDLAIGLTDGETNERRFWVLFVAIRAWEPHPDLELVRRPKGIPGMPHYIPTGYNDFYKFRVRSGVDKIEVPTLTYPIEAKSSYLVFRNLRDRGVIPRDTRFQVCIPFPEDAARLFAHSARDMEIMANGYADAAARDVESILHDIPANDLVLQWDINWETLAVAFDDYAGEEPMEYKANGDPMERYLRFVRQLCGPVPKEVVLGLHLCYGDLHHRHFLEPKTLATCVRLANAAASEAGRRIDFVHMPIPRARDDDEYFGPLKDLKIGDSTLYAGLVHYTDGVEGSRRRLERLRKHYAGVVGVATECGMGRRPPDQSFGELLRIHREVVEAI
ncbi:MAG TPA: hypothetical protein VMV15_06065 [Candidatus Binataceae bacterium]|nr:hypothetical protein [Candidatus Binataceae bacterium]